MNLLDKLKGVHEQYGKIIVAFDFDDTLYAYGMYGDEAAISKAQSLVYRCLETGQTLLLFTCREGNLLDEALFFCEQNGMFFEHVNENPLQTFTSRKPFFNILIDDKAGIYEASKILEEYLDWVEQKNGEKA